MTVLARGTSFARPIEFLGQGIRPQTRLLAALPTSPLLEVSRHAGVDDPGRFTVHAAVYRGEPDEQRFILREPLAPVSEKPMESKQRRKG